MKVTIPYGSEKTVAFSVPDENFCELLEPSCPEFENNPEAIIEEALNNPIGTPVLEEVVKGAETVSVICDDMARPTPAYLILPSVMKRLHKAGIKKENIKVIIALGSHRYMTEEEIVQKVGREIYDNYRVVNSEFKDEESLVLMGTAEDGSQIYVTGEAASTDIRIGIGNIVPHPVMGWSGGGKILFPGISGEKTVALFHIMGGLHPNGNLFGWDESPVRHCIESWVDVIGLDFIINTALTGDFRIYKAVAGHYIKAHREGIKYAKEIWGAKTTKKADIMIVSSYPADQDFWQSGKGLYSAENGLVDEGGTIILVSPNFEGIGPHPELYEYMGDDNAHEKLVRAKDDDSIPGDRLAMSVGTAMAKMRMRREIIMVSDGITEADAKACGIGYYPLADLQKAIDDTIKKYDNPTVSAISHGGELYVY